MDRVERIEFESVKRMKKQECYLHLVLARRLARLWHDFDDVHEQDAASDEHLNEKRVEHREKEIETPKIMN